MMRMRIVDPSLLDELRLMVDFDLAESSILNDLSRKEAIKHYLATLEYTVDWGESTHGCTIAWIKDIDGNIVQPVLAAFDTWDALIGACCIALQHNAPIFYESIFDARRFMPEALALSIEAIKILPVSTASNAEQPVSNDHPATDQEISLSSDKVIEKLDSSQSRSQHSHPTTPFLKFTKHFKDFIGSENLHHEQMNKLLGGYGQIQSNLIPFQKMSDSIIQSLETITQSCRFESQLRAQESLLSTIVGNAEWVKKITESPAMRGLEQLNRQMQLIEGITNNIKAESFRRLMPHHLNTLANINTLNIRP
jgi:hypothetical protein